MLNNAPSQHLETGSVQFEPTPIPHHQLLGRAAELRQTNSAGVAGQMDATRQRPKEVIIRQELHPYPGPPTPQGPEQKVWGISPPITFGVLDVLGISMQKQVRAAKMRPIIENEEAAEKEASPQGVETRSRGHLPSYSVWRFGCFGGSRYRKDTRDKDEAEDRERRSSQEGGVATRGRKRCGGIYPPVAFGVSEVPKDLDIEELRASDIKPRLENQESRQEGG